MHIQHDSKPTEIEQEETAENLRGPRSETSNSKSFFAILMAA
jgi:hypothetical protein